MKTFSGFPAGKMAYTPLPNLFFTELLPLIDDLAELKVTLHIFWRLYRMQAQPRCVSRAQLTNDTTLLRSLNELRRPVDEALDDGLERAVTRGTLLKMVAGDSELAWYFPNTDQGRRAVERIQVGDLELPSADLRPADAPAAVERPNIFVLYERNIGVLTPFIAEQLRDAEETYPAEWIEEAFRRAVEQNVRKWAYVRGILDRWAREGRDDGADRPLSREDPKRYVTGPYADYIEH
jgi:DNA replication protein